MSREETTAVIARYIDASDNGNLDVLAELVHPDLRYIIPAALPNGGVMHGAKAFLDMMGNLTDFYVPESISINREPPIIDDGRAALRFTVAATTASGNPYFNRYVIVVLVKDGKITEIDEHLDTRYLAQKMYGD
jgi:ketosteroid isomerase-like protein